MSVHHHVIQFVVREFFCQKCFILLENDKTGFLVFSPCYQTHQDKIASQIQVNVWPNG